MQVTEVRLTKASPNDSCLAYGSFTLDGVFVVSGIRVLKSKNDDYFVGFPSKKNSKGEYKDICFPMKKTLREDISTAVLSEYEQIANS